MTSEPFLATFSPGSNL